MAALSFRRSCRFEINKITLVNSMTYECYASIIEQLADLIGEPSEWNFVGSFSLRPLFRAESPIAGVAQTGNDKSISVEVIVNRRGPKFHVRMDAAQPFDALR